MKYDYIIKKKYNKKKYQRYIFYLLVIIFFAVNTILVNPWAECWYGSYSYYCSGKNVYWSMPKNCFYYHYVTGWGGGSYSQCYWSSSTTQTGYAGSCNQYSYTSWGTAYCSSNDLYSQRQKNTMGCSGGSCYWQGWVPETKMIQDCGSDTYSTYSDPLCATSDGGVTFDVYKARYKYDRGCSTSGADHCFLDTLLEFSLQEDCGTTVTSSDKYFCAGQDTNGYWYFGQGGGVPNWGMDIHKGNFLDVPGCLDGSCTMNYYLQFDDVPYQDCGDSYCDPPSDWFCQPGYTNVINRTIDCHFKGCRVDGVVQCIFTPPTEFWEAYYCPAGTTCDFPSGQCVWPTTRTTGISENSNMPTVFRLEDINNIEDDIVITNRGANAVYYGYLGSGPNGCGDGAELITYCSAPGVTTAQMAAQTAVYSDNIDCAFGFDQASFNQFDTKFGIYGCIAVWAGQWVWIQSYPEYFLVETSCGDGKTSGNETCDDGNLNTNDACPTCNVSSYCGDGYRWTVSCGASCEQCDDGNDIDSDNCVNCNNAGCGDGYLWDGVENCDDGNLLTTDACTDCNEAYCGDTFVWFGKEGCDDGNTDNTDSCIECIVAVCGDGYLRAGVEDCDDGNADNTDSCVSCNVAVCGDGFVHSGVEECDDSNINNNDACLNNCSSAICGDGYKWVGTEDCDDANNISTDACVACVNAVCGDGYTLDGNEECDDGDADNNNECLNNCSVAACGDSYIWTGVEDCEDGNFIDSDSCVSCTTAYCGDGFTRASIETCDDGGLCSSDNSGCLSDLECNRPGGGCIDNICTGDKITPCVVDADCKKPGGTCVPQAGDGCSLACHPESETCNFNYIDEDLDGDTDYDSQDGKHGDSDCPVEVTAITVSDSNPCPGESITVECTSSIANINSISAELDSAACTYINWFGNTVRFTCNSGLVGSGKIANCFVDTSKSYKSGTDKQTTINVGGSSCCSGYSVSGTCNADSACDWCPECSGTKYSGGADRCVTSGICSYYCWDTKCSAECDATNTVFNPVSCVDFCSADILHIQNDYTNYCNDGVGTDDCTITSYSCADASTSDCGSTSCGTNAEGTPCSNCLAQPGEDICSVCTPICACSVGWKDSDSNTVNGCECRINDHIECYSGDEYYYDSCGTRENLANSCGTDSCDPFGAWSCTLPLDGTKTRSHLCHYRGCSADVCTYSNGMEAEAAAANAEVCTGGVDEDCDGHTDYDSTDGNHGDNNCPVAVTVISVSDSNPCPSESITIECTASVASINSVSAELDSNACIWQAWNGNLASFTCNTGALGNGKIAKCFIDTSKSYKSGVDQTTVVNVGGSGCCSVYGDTPSCEADISCDWCNECSGTKWSGDTSRCLTAGTCSYNCWETKCGAACDITNTVFNPVSCVDFCSADILHIQDDYTNYCNDGIGTDDCTITSYSCVDASTSDCGSTSCGPNAEGTACSNCFPQVGEDICSACTPVCVCSEGWKDGDSNTVNGCECKLNDTLQCFAGDVYYYDSCGGLGFLNDTCGTSDCDPYGSWSCVMPVNGLKTRDRLCHDRGCSSGSCTYSTRIEDDTVDADIEICTDSLDNDCDGESDYDSLDGMHGDSDCPTGITAISVSNINPCPYEIITVNCTATTADINSVLTELDGNGCTWLGWNGNKVSFSCDAGALGNGKIARCYVNTSRSYAIAGQEERTATVDVGGVSCCNAYANSPSCEGDASCDWCNECSANAWSGGADRCVDAGICTYNCNNGNCGAGCTDIDFIDGDGCSAACIMEFCGDGTTNNIDEECDDANSDNNDACLNNCSSARCGDTYHQAGVEECDDGNNADNDSCSSGCKTEYCGDSIVNNINEECDDGNSVDNDVCADCINAKCGDGHVWTIDCGASCEQCDDNNKLDGDGCSSACASEGPFCGDGEINGPGEECDDGNMLNTDLCLNNCTLPTCGDNHICFGYEDCDDGPGGICPDDCYNRTRLTEFIIEDRVLNYNEHAGKPLNYRLKIKYFLLNHNFIEFDVRNPLIADESSEYDHYLSPNNCLESVKDGESCIQLWFMSSTFESDIELYDLPEDIFASASYNSRPLNPLDLFAKYEMNDPTRQPDVEKSPFFSLRMIPLTNHTIPSGSGVIRSPSNRLNMSSWNYIDSYIFNINDIGNWGCTPGYSGLVDEFICGLN